MRNIPARNYITVVFDLIRQFRQILNLLQIQYKYDSCLPEIPLERTYVSHARRRQLVWFREPLKVIPAVYYYTVLPTPWPS
jgi:hypothetical protein